MVEASPYARRTTRNRVKSARMICKPIWMWYMHALINKKCIRAAVSPPQAEIFAISSCSYAFFLTKTRFSEGFLTAKSQNFLDWGANYEKAPPCFRSGQNKGGLFHKGGFFIGIGLIGIEKKRNREKIKNDSPGRKIRKY